jgi:hypothetical protein
VELDTRALTIGGLATTLVAQGYTTSTPDPAIAPLSTAILAEERGAPFAGRAFLGIATSALWRIFVPVALEGRALREDAETAIEQLDARLAFGRWLDQLAILHGTQRVADEPDATLRLRLNYQVIQHHTTNASLSRLVKIIGGVANSVIDGPVDYLRAGESGARTLSRRQERPRFLLPSVAPRVTITLHETLVPDVSPYPIRDEVGVRFWVRALPTQNRLLSARKSGEGYFRLPPGVKGYYRPFVDRALLPMHPQRTGRALWHLIDDYKAGGVKHILRIPRVLALVDRSPLELPLQSGVTGEGQNSMPIAGFVRRVLITRVLPVPATSQVGQVVVTSALVIGPTRVGTGITTTVGVRSLIRAQVRTSANVAINALTTETTVWPAERQVVRAGVTTTARILARVHVREGE